MQWERSLDHERLATVVLKTRRPVGTRHQSRRPVKPCKKAKLEVNELELDTRQKAPKAPLSPPSRLTGLAGVVVSEINGST